MCVPVKLSCPSTHSTTVKVFDPFKHGYIYRITTLATSVTGSKNNWQVSSIDQSTLKHNYIPKRQSQKGINARFLIAAGSILSHDPSSL